MFITLKISDAISKAGFNAAEDEAKKLRQYICDNPIQGSNGFKPKYGHIKLSLVCIISSHLFLATVLAIICRFISKPFNVFNNFFPKSKKWI